MPRNDTDHPVNVSDQRPGDAGAAPSDVYDALFRLAADSTSRQRFMAEALRQIARDFDSPYAALHVRYAAEVVQDETHRGPTDPAFWKSGVQRFLTESLTEPRPWARLLKARNGSAKVAFLSAPIHDRAGRAIGALAVVVHIVDENRDRTERLARLESLCRVASLAVELVAGSRPPVSSASGSAATTARATGAAGLQSDVEIAFAITHELRNRLGCEQVALGIVVGRRIRILSISGLDHVNNRSPGVAALRAAMEECLDAGRIISHPNDPSSWSPGDDLPPLYHLHRQWHSECAGGHVASIPLRSGDTVVAVLSLRSAADHPLSPAKLDEIRARVEPYGPSLLLARRAARGLPRHVADATRETLRSLIAPGHPRRKVLAAVGLAATLFFFFGSMNFDITVPCAVAPVHARHVAAPFDGVLASVVAVQGDRVRKGDVLCELDRRELDRQRLELVAQLDVLDREHDKAMAERSPAAARLALANRELTRARLAILDRRIEQTVVRAPVDGVVIQGDPRALVGAVLPRGEPLYRVAPTDRWTLELAVPEWAADEVAAGMSGSFLAFTRPAERLPFSVERIRPSAESRHNRNVFVAEAPLADGGDWLKPGMDGVARLSAGRRPVWWIALHRAIDYVNLNFGQ